MENKIVERCGLRKFLGEDCDKTTYYTNIGRLDISNYDYKNSLVWCSKEVYTLLKLVIQSAFIMRKFTMHTIKHGSYFVLTCIKYIWKKLAQDFIFQNSLLQEH